MKRFLYPMLWSGFVSLLLLTLVVAERRTHAESASDISLHRKISKDILERVANGKGADLVRVIIQPVSEPDPSLDATLEDSGSNIRKLKSFRARILTVPAHTAVTLASRKDVAYVSLNRDVQPMGHLSVTTGAEQVRATPNTSGSTLDGTGIGIAVLDSGMDASHTSFLNRSNGCASFTVKTSPAKDALTIRTATARTSPHSPPGTAASPTRNTSVLRQTRI